MSKVFRAWEVDEVWLFPASVQDFCAAWAHCTPDQGDGSRGIGSEGDSLAVRRGAGLSALPSGDDDGTFALCLQPGDLLVAADRSGLPRARRLYGGDGAELPGFPHDQRVSQADSGGGICAVW